MILLLKFTKQQGSANITERSPSFPDSSIRVDHGHNHQRDESGFVCPVLIIIFKMLLSSTTEF